MNLSRQIVAGSIALAAAVTLSLTACGAPVPATSAVDVEILSALEGHPTYMAHCAACHGPTGHGNGPAAIAMKVRPRDFWGEPFRYVSTLNGVPTDEDLIQSIRFGRRFGEMPAGPQLTDAELRGLAQYVREIQRLGWVKKLRAKFSEEDDGDEASDEDDEGDEDDDDDEELSPEEIEEISHIRVKPRGPIDVTGPSSDFRRDLGKGRKLYIANCASCHGPTGRGDGPQELVDEEGRPIRARDMTSGRFRGGGETNELFKRIRVGIPGTPMPAQNALSDDEVLQLVYYVRYLARHK